MPKRAPTQLLSTQPPPTHEHDEHDEHEHDEQHEHEAEDPMQQTLNALKAVPWLTRDVMSIVMDLLFFMICECGEKINVDTEFCINNLFENIHDHPAGRKYKFCKGFNHLSCSVCEKDICCMCSSYGLCSVVKISSYFLFFHQFSSYFCM